MFMFTGNINERKLSLVMKRSFRNIDYFCIGKRPKHEQMMVIQLWRGSLFLSFNDYLIAQTKLTNTNTSHKPHAY